MCTPKRASTTRANVRGRSFTRPVFEQQKACFWAYQPTEPAGPGQGKNETKGHVRLPGTAFASAPTPDGSRLLAVLRDRSSLAVLELSTRRVVDEVPMPRLPQSVVVDSAGALAYVSCTPADRVVTVDLRSHAVVASTRVGAGADGLALTQGPGSTN